MRWTSRHIALGALWLLIGACADARRDVDVAQVQAALDFDAGDAQGVVRWNGDEVSGLAAQGMFAWIPGPSSGWAGYAYVEPDGSYAFSNVLPGSYTLSLDQNGCGQPEGEIGQTSLTISAGMTTTADVDITASAGKVIGSITVNGSPLSSPSISVDGLCGTWGSDASGQFAHFMPPGTYTATVRTPSDTFLGTFSVTTTAGATTDLGSIEFSSGDAQGVVRWNGDEVSGLAAQGMFAWIPGPSSSWAGYAYVEPDGSYAFSNVLPGSYTLNLDQNGCGQPEGEIGQRSLTISAGMTTTADVDITASAGKVIGSITVNGSPLSSPSISVDGLCGTWGSDASGQFAHFMPPGTYTATVRTPSNTFLGTFSFTTTAGATTDLGSIEFSSGDAQGVVRWNGDEVSGLAAQGMFAWIPGPSSSWAGYAYVEPDGSYAFSNVLPGSYTLNLDQNGCGQPEGEIGQRSLTISAGMTTTADVDITASAGKVIGSITVNGSPLSSPSISVDGLCGTWGSDASGQFAHFLPPGTYTATVRTPSSTFLGTFTFTILFSQTTDVDIGTTQAGIDVSVDLSGGIASIGGISLAFSEVLSSGNTTVVESGAGQPPPTGFRIVGLSGQPRYWDIDTTATYSGPISVCIHYDPAQAQGNESNIRLVHDDGSGWQDVTSSIDTAADIVCGTATSLSPFAVVEPLDGDGDADNVPDSIDQCASTQPGAVTDATGCSIDDLVPCAGAWKNHGAYVKAFTTAAKTFQQAGLIDATTKEDLVSAAAHSKCGIHG